jgi:hypothetical protein
VIRASNYFVRQLCDPTGDESERRIMRLCRSTVAWVPAFVACVVGLLWLGTVPGDLGHALFGDALCGPWG